jgi:hypothetical protein
MKLLDIIRLNRIPYISQVFGEVKFHFKKNLNEIEIPFFFIEFKTSQNNQDKIE